MKSKTRIKILKRKSNLSLPVLKNFYYQKHDNKEVPVTNFRIHYNRIIKPLDGSGEMFIEGTVHFEDGEECNFAWPLIVMSRPDQFRYEISRIRPGGCWYMSKAIPELLPIIGATNHKWSISYYVKEIGYHGNKYIMPSVIIENGKVDKNTEYSFRGDSAILKYDFTLADKDVAEKALDFLLGIVLKMQSPGVMLPLIAEIFRSPIMDKIGGLRYVKSIEGMTGAGKSLILKVLLNLYRLTDINTDSLFSANSTPNAIEMIGYYLKDALMVWDDFKKGISNKKDIVGVTQRYQNQHGRERLTKDLELQRSFYIRANLFITGEQLLIDDEKSSIERGLIIRVPKNSLNLSQVDVIKENAHSLNTIMPYYIAYTQKNPVEEWKGSLGVCDARLTSYVRQNLTGLKCFCDFVKAEFPNIALKYDVDRLFEEGIEAATDAARMTSDDAQQAEDVEIFLEAIRAGIASRDLCIRGLGKDYSEGKIIGEKDIEGINLIPNACIRQLEIYCNKSFTSNALGRSLKEKGYLVRTRLKTGNPTILKRLSNFGGSVVVWCVKKEILLGDENSRVKSVT